MYNLTMHIQTHYLPLKESKVKAEPKDWSCHPVMCNIPEELTTTWSAHTSRLTKYMQICCGAWFAKEGC